MILWQRRLTFLFRFFLLLLLLLERIGKKKGKTGDWKNHFSPELNERIDKWMEAHLAGTDLRFVTELEEQD